MAANAKKPMMAPVQYNGNLGGKDLHRCTKYHACAAAFKGVAGREAATAAQCCCSRCTHWIPAVSIFAAAPGLLTRFFCVRCSRARAIPT